MLKFLWLFCIPWVPSSPTIEVESQWGWQTDRWKPVVEEVLEDYGIPDQVDAFMRVMHCESRGDPDAYNVSSGASGLMQHLQYYWQDRADAIGMSDATPFNPIANIYASAWLLTTAGGGWVHWTCYGL